MKRVVIVISLVVAISLAGCTSQDELTQNGLNQSESTQQKPENEGQTEQPAFSQKIAEVLATNLDVPWDIIKHEDVFYISERPGRIIKLTSNGQVKKMPLHLKKDVVQNGEGGLLGFVLAPDFSSSKTAYIYHTYRQNDELFNRIVMIEWTGKSWEEQNVLLNRIPGASIHNGGRLKIGPDGKLYATTGDASVSENAQDLNSLSGKILRMNLDGSIPETNPFPNSYVYSYGHRNPQGLAWSKDDTMYEAEHGSIAHDEINLIQPGKNYGWPVIRGKETKKSMVTPLFQSGENTWAPSGLTYHNGALYVAGLQGAEIRKFDLKDHSSKIVFQGVGRLRDIIIQDDFAYVITNNTDGRGNPKPDDDRLLKINLLNLD